MVVSRNGFLVRAEQEENAQYIMSYFTKRGWTKNAVAGMLGNMQTESTINPGIWQSLYVGWWSGGYGLVQWTPATKLKRWCDSNGYKYNTMKGQLARIQYEVDNEIQWIKRPDIGMNLSFKEFSKSTKPPEELARYFIRCYERPKNQVQPNRSKQARYWYDHLDGKASVGEGEDPDKPTGSGYQLAVLPFKTGTWHISQGGYDDTSYSHSGTTAIDWSTYASGSKYYAPCDCKCIHITNSSQRHMVFWRSTKKVMCADGKLRWIAWDCVHQNVLWQKVGMKLKKGEEMGETGSFGPGVTGPHLHLQVVEGKTFPGYMKNRRGKWSLKGKVVDQWKVFATNGCDITNLAEYKAKGYDFKEVDWEDGEGGDNEEGEKDHESGRDNMFIMLWACDALRGMKGGWSGYD